MYRSRSTHHIKHNNFLKEKSYLIDPIIFKTYINKRKRINVLLTSD